MPAYTPIENDLDLQKYLKQAPVKVILATAMVPMPPSMAN